MRELAAVTSLKPTLVHWHLKNLERHRVVRRDADSQKYELGFKLFELSNRVHKLTVINKIARPVLRELSEATGGTAVLRILDGDELLCLASVDSPASLRVQYTAGSRVPINFGAVGKVVMAFLPAERIVELIAKGSVKKVTEKTVTEPSILKRQLAQIRLRGWVSTIGEAIPGTRGIAAPIWDDTGEPLGGIGLTFPAVNLPDSKVEKLAKSVIKAAHRISVELGRKDWNQPARSYRAAAK